MATCACESPILNIDHDATCRRCGREVDFTTLRGIETHWSITITQGTADTRVSCGCGWRTDLIGNGVAAMNRGRVLWQNHDCNGRQYAGMGRTGAYDAEV